MAGARSSGWTLVRPKAETCWTAFLRKLARRGPRGVKLIVSDVHEGSRRRSERSSTPPGSAAASLHAQHLAHAGKSGRRVVSAFIATAFAQDDAEAARAHRRRIADQLRPQLPTLAIFLEEAETDVPANMRFSAAHRATLHSTNQLERLNDEAKRRTEAVGIFPNADAITRLVGVILLKQNDEQAVKRGRRMTLKTTAPSGDDPTVSFPAIARQRDQPAFFESGLALARIHESCRSVQGRDPPHSAHHASAAKTCCGCWLLVTGGPPTCDTHRLHRSTRFGPYRRSPLGHRILDAAAEVLSDIKLAQTCFGEPAIRLILPERCSPAGRLDDPDPHFHRGALHLPKIVIAPRIGLGGLQAVWNKTLCSRLRSHLRDLRARTPPHRIEHSNAASCSRNGYEEIVDQTSKHRSSDCLQGEAARTRCTKPTNADVSTSSCPFSWISSSISEPNFIQICFSSRYAPIVSSLIAPRFVPLNQDSG